GSLDERFDEIFASGYSVSVFTNFRLQKLWAKRLAADAPPGKRWFGATAATGPRNPVPDVPADNTTEQLGVSGPWHERLPHFRPDHLPSSGRELQSEYLVPRHHAVAALHVVRALRGQLIPVLQVAELRTVAADELWLSPSYRRETAAFHFTWVDDAAAVLPIVRALERGLAPFHPRPHWGKVFDMSPESVGAEYERMPAFRELIREFDPHRKFSNSLVDKYVVG
ncbi:MAG: D-arabinono-1,4-lactone oxidase, partial [Pseudonocardiales bacterium]